MPTGDLFVFPVPPPPPLPPPMPPFGAPGGWLPPDFDGDDITWLEFFGILVFALVIIAAMFVVCVWSSKL